MSLRYAALTTVLTLGLASAVQAQDVNIDFEGEVVGTEADGLVLENVLFEFFVGGEASSDATVQPYVLGCTSFLCGTVIEGTTEGGAQLVLNFLDPLTAVEFGLAAGTTESTFANLSLFDPEGVSLGTFVLDLSPRDPFAFAEGMYSSGSTTLGRIAIDLSPADFAVRFAIDNVTGRSPSVSVPEPTTWMLLGSGLFMLGLAVWRRREDAVEA